MLKRSYLFYFLLVSGLLLAYIQPVFAWEALIHAEGEIYDNNVYQSDAYFGYALEADPLPSASLPPSASVEIYFMDLTTTPPSQYFQDVKEIGEPSYDWLLKVDRNGVEDDTFGTSRSVTFSWTPAELGYGIYELKYYGGDTVLANMKTADPPEVTTSGVGPIYYTIHMSPEECGGSYPLPQDTWLQIALPCEPDIGLDTVADVYGGNFTGDYNVTWVLYERDEANDEYNILASDSPLIQGKGYWIYTTEADVALDLTGTETPVTTPTECPGGCFEIPLLSPVGGATSLYNMVSNPLAYPVKWSDVKFSLTGETDSPFTPSEADARGYISKNIYMYNGNGYDTFDDVTIGMEGVLGPHEGFWVEATDNTWAPGNGTLLIPSGIGSIAALYQNSKDEVQVAEVSDSWLKRWFNWLLPDANAAPKKKTPKNPPGDAQPDAHKKTHEQSVQKGEEWYVRLTVESSGENLRDSNNVFGQLKDSQKGYDEHDLKELPPFGEKYLTIVFPHMDWGDRADDYASDFHPFRNRKGNDAWEFEVRTDDPTRELVLSWSGPEDILLHSQLIDEETGEVLAVNPDGSYTFKINGTSRKFSWEYSQKGK